MSFLTPLYVLGALAVAAPILFHLIQRRPKGETHFSSLMFLSPSPPRLTRRSKLDNWLLLLLRALAITMLAIAFGRPFLRSALQLDYNSMARRTVILLDTSASMKREGIWAKAMEHVASICDESSNSDQLALLTFDTDTKTVVGFQSAGQGQTDHVKDLIKRSLDSLQPTWKTTDLGAALTAACDRLQDAASADGSIETPPQIVVVSDLQQGAGIRALEAFDWPENIPVDLRVVNPTKTGNAFVQTMQAQGEDPTEDVIVRIENLDVASGDRFELKWQREDGIFETQKTLQVPMGQSRVVRFERDEVTSQLLLVGDAEPFDNTLYFANPAATQRRIAIVGMEDTIATESLESEKGPLYFLQRINLSNRFRNVTFVPSAENPEVLTSLSPVQTPLVVVGGNITKQDAEVLHAYLKSGGNVLGVLTENNYEQQAVEAWQTLTGLERLSISEADVDDYAILSNIDFRHPFFVPFAESQFNDFTKIRYWAYRHLNASHEQAWDVLARFDNSAPAIVERAIGNGTLWVFASGWHPSDSQLALSSKFVPIISSMFDASDTMRHTAETFFVGDQIPLGFSETTNPVKAQIHVSNPDGQVVSVENAAFSPERPGVYSAIQGDEITSFAVNLGRAESSTVAMDQSQLEQYGVRLGSRQSVIDMTEHQRQMKDVELESNQQIWRLLIVGALVVLTVETWLAGTKSKSTSSF